MLESFNCCSVLGWKLLWACPFPLPPFGRAWSELVWTWALSKRFHQPIRSSLTSKHERQLQIWILGRGWNACFPGGGSGLPHNLQLLLQRFWLLEKTLWVYVSFKKSQVLTPLHPGLREQDFYCQLPEGHQHIWRFLILNHIAHRHHRWQIDWRMGNGSMGCSVMFSLFFF